MAGAQLGMQPITGCHPAAAKPAILYSATGLAVHDQQQSQLSTRDAGVATLELGDSHQESQHGCATGSQHSDYACFDGAQGECVNCAGRSTCSGEIMSYCTACSPPVDGCSSLQRQFLLLLTISQNVSCHLRSLPCGVFLSFWLTCQSHEGRFWSGVFGVVDGRNLRGCRWVGTVGEAGHHRRVESWTYTRVD